MTLGALGRRKRGSTSARMRAGRGGARRGRRWSGAGAAAMAHTRLPGSDRCRLALGPPLARVQPAQQRVALAAAELGLCHHCGCQADGKGAGVQGQGLEGPGSVAGGRGEGKVSVWARLRRLARPVEHCKDCRELPKSAGGAGKGCLLRRRAPGSHGASIAPATHNLCSVPPLPCSSSNGTLQLLRAQTLAESPAHADQRLAAAGGSARERAFAHPADHAP